MVVARYLDRQSNNPGNIDFVLNGSAVNSFALDKDSNRYHTQTVTSNITLREGDEFSISISGEDAAFDYLEFVSLDNLLLTPLDTVGSSSSSSSSISSISSTSVDGSSSLEFSSFTSGNGSAFGSFTNNGATTLFASEWDSALRVEAETMTLLGDYVVANNSESSGGALIGSWK